MMMMKPEMEPSKHPNWNKESLLKGRKERREKKREERKEVEKGRKKEKENIRKLCYEVV